MLTVNWDNSKKCEFLWLPKMSVHSLKFLVSIQTLSQRQILALDHESCGSHSTSVYFECSGGPDNCMGCSMPGSLRYAASHTVIRTPLSIKNIQSLSGAHNFGDPKPKSASGCSTNLSTAAPICRSRVSVACGMVSDKKEHCSINCALF